MPTDAILEAIRQLESLRDLSLEERKVRLAELKEEYRLQGLYEMIQSTESKAEGNTAVNEELDTVRSHLEPLGLAPEGTPLSELARLAALKITKQ